MSERYPFGPPGPDYLMQVAGDDDRAESTGGRGYDQGAERAWQVASESSAEARDMAPEFDI